MSNDQLPRGDRDEPGEAPRPGEKPSEFLARVAASDYTPPPPAGSCVCKSRGWVCGHGPSPEQRIDAIFDAREPGSDG